MLGPHPSSMLGVDHSVSQVLMSDVCRVTYRGSWIRGLIQGSGSV